MKNQSLILLFTVILTSCIQFKTPQSEESVENDFEIIASDDYYISYDPNENKVYHHSDDSKMTGHYIVEKDAVRSEEFYVENGLLYKTFTTYYPDGSMANTIQYNNGIKNGEDIFYFKSGKVKRKSEYLNGEQKGKSTEFREDGSVYMEWEIENGKSRSKFFENGKLVHEEYDIDYNGRELGVSRVYDTTGKVKLSLGFVMVDNTMKEDVLYILDEQDKVVDSIDPNKDRMKAMQLIMSMGKGM